MSGRNPDWPLGFVPTPAQWNAEWSTKVDATDNFGNPLVLGFQLIAAGVNENVQFGTIPLPPSAYIVGAAFRETSGNAMNVAIGTTLGGFNVMPSISVPASGTVTATTQAFSKNWFSATQTQSLFLTVSGSGILDAQLVYQIGP